MIQLGDIVSQRPSIEGWETIGFRPGRVIYIHPEGRFYVAEFEFVRDDRRARFREAYIMERSRAAEPETPQGRHYGNVSRAYSFVDGKERLGHRKRKKERRPEA